MGDLISRSALIKMLETYKFGCLINEVERDYIKETMIEFVKTEPTAYNVEKVVAELEKASDFFGGEPMGSLQKMYYCKGIEKALEIVKAGGVDD